MTGTLRAHFEAITALRRQLDNEKAHHAVTRQALETAQAEVRRLQVRAYGCEQATTTLDLYPEGTARAYREK